MEKELRPRSRLRQVSLRQILVVVAAMAMLFWLMANMGDHVSVVTHTVLCVAFLLAIVHLVGFETPAVATAILLAAAIVAVTFHARVLTFLIGEEKEPSMAAWLAVYLSMPPCHLMIACRRIHLRRWWSAALFFLTALGLMLYSAVGVGFKFGWHSFFYPPN